MSKYFVLKPLAEVLSIETSATLTEREFCEKFKEFCDGRQMYEPDKGLINLKKDEKMK